MPPASTISPGSSTAVTTETTGASFDASSATTRRARSSPSRAVSAFGDVRLRPASRAAHHRVARRHNLDRAWPVGRHACRNPVVRQIRDFPGRAVRPAKQLAVDEDSHSDARSDGQARHHVDALRRASGMLTDGAQIGVLRDDTVQPFAVTTTHTADQVASADVVFADLSSLDVESTDDGVVLNAREAR